MSVSEAGQQGSTAATTVDLTGDSRDQGGSLAHAFWDRQYFKKVKSNRAHRQCCKCNLVLQGSHATTAKAKDHARGCKPSLDAFPELKKDLQEHDASRLKRGLDKLVVLLTILS